MSRSKTIYIFFLNNNNYYKLGQNMSAHKKSASFVFPKWEKSIERRKKREPEGSVNNALVWGKS